MTNTIKQTLTERLEVVTQELTHLASEKNLMIIERAKNEFQDALMNLPEVEIKISYGDSIYFNFEDKEILSIHTKGGFGSRPTTHYLNTYSTWIEDGFELKRLVFNGLVAGKVLADGEVYSRIFAEDVELKEKTKLFANEQYELQRTIREIEQREATDKKEKALKKFFAGEEVEFESMQTIQYARSRWDWMYRVSKMKCLNYDKKKDAVTVEFTCKSYQKEDPDQVVTKEAVKMKYLNYHID